MISLGLQMVRVLCYVIGVVGAFLATTRTHVASLELEYMITLKMEDQRRPNFYVVST